MDDVKKLKEAVAGWARQYDDLEEENQKLKSILMDVREKIKEEGDEAHENNDFDTCDILDGLRDFIDEKLGI